MTWTQILQWSAVSPLAARKGLLAAAAEVHCSRITPGYQDLSAQGCSVGTAQAIAFTVPTPPNRRDAKTSGVTPLLLIPVLPINIIRHRNMRQAAAAAGRGVCLHRTAPVPEALRPRALWNTARRKEFDSDIETDVQGPGSGFMCGLWYSVLCSCYSAQMTDTVSHRSP